jgi:hypothetical protein
MVFLESSQFSFVIPSFFRRFLERSQAFCGCISQTEDFSLSAFLTHSELHGAKQFGGHGETIFGMWGDFLLVIESTRALKQNQFPKQLIYDSTVFMTTLPNGFCGPLGLQLNTVGSFVRDNADRW